MRYFRLFEDLYIPDRWYLDTPRDAREQDSGSWLFMQGEPASVEEPLTVKLFKPGKPIDDAACGEVQRWKPEDGRPEKTGRYRGVINLRIDKARVGDAKVFRTWGWNVALIVSEGFKDALERTGATGMEFTEV